RRPHAPPPGGGPPSSGAGRGARRPRPHHTLCLPSPRNRPQPAPLRRVRAQGGGRGLLRPLHLHPRLSRLGDTPSPPSAAGRLCPAVGGLPRLATGERL